MAHGSEKKDPIVWLWNQDMKSSEPQLLLEELWAVWQDGLCPCGDQSPKEVPQGFPVASWQGVSWSLAETERDSGVLEQEGNLLNSQPLIDRQGNWGLGD